LLLISNFNSSIFDLKLPCFADSKVSNFKTLKDLDSKNHDC